ncbi:unnamed protein product, partial [Polarella glacialis]
FAPIGGNGWVLLGETGKYVSVSSKRFLSVEFTSSGIAATLAGAAGEEVFITALRPHNNSNDDNNNKNNNNKLPSQSRVAEWTVLVQRIVFSDAERQGPANTTSHYQRIKMQ